MLCNIIWIDGKIEECVMDFVSVPCIGEIISISDIEVSKRYLNNRTHADVVVQIVHKPEFIGGDPKVNLLVEHRRF